MTEVVRITGPESSTKANISFVIKIAGEEYDARLQWLPRIEQWSLYVNAPNGEAVIIGLRVTSDTSILGDFTDLRLPQAGHLVVVDTQAKGQPPSRDDLKDRHTILYMVLDEPVDDFTIKVDGQGEPS